MATEPTMLTDDKRREIEEHRDFIESVFKKSRRTHYWQSANYFKLLLAEIDRLKVEAKFAEALVADNPNDFHVNWRAARKLYEKMGQEAPNDPDKR